MPTTARPARLFFFGRAALMTGADSGLERGLDGTGCETGDDERADIGGWLWRASSSSKSPADASGVCEARAAAMGSLNAAAFRSTTPESLWWASAARVTPLGGADGCDGTDGLVDAGGGVFAILARSEKLRLSRSGFPIL